MRKRSFDVMQSILRYIQEFLFVNDRLPSTTEIAEEMNFSRSTAYYYLKDMDKNGLIDYSNGSIHVSLGKIDTTREPVAMLGSIPCGSAQEEEENVEYTTTLPVAVFGRGPFYMLHATGDSMVDEGIWEGDLLVIRKQDYAQVGQIVVALDENNQNTLKKYGGIDEESGKAMLKYCNASVYGDKTIYVPILVCQGVLSHIIKER